MTPSNEDEAILKEVFPSGYERYKGKDINVNWITLKDVKKAISLTREAERKSKDDKIIRCQKCNNILRSEAGEEVEKYGEGTFSLVCDYCDKKKLEQKLKDKEEEIKMLRKRIDEESRWKLEAQNKLSSQKENILGMESLINEVEKHFELPLNFKLNRNEWKALKTKIEGEQK